MSVLRRTLGALSALALVAGAGFLTPPAAQAEDVQDAGVPAWLAYERPAEFGTAAEEIRVPMRDGVLMRCTKLGPASDGDAKHPVVVVNYFAYRWLQQTAFLPMAEGLAQRGYVTLSCSPRGSGGTPGTWAPFQVQESQDNHDLIEWAAKQAWSNGRVGQTGVSYGGISTMKAIATKPPHLMAAVPVVAYNEVYREMVYPGGARGTTLRWWPAVTWASSTADQSPAISAETMPDFTAFEKYAEEHPLFDSYWSALSIDSKAVDRANVPTLAIGGWNDLFPQGTVRNYLRAKDQTTLLMLPGAHGEFAPGVPQFQAGLNAMLSWFDRYLMQREHVPKPGAKVTSWELPRLSGRWVELADYPTRGERLTFGPLSSSFTVNPYDNGCSCVEHGLYSSTDYPINDQRIYDQGRVRVDSAPWESNDLILGAPVARIRAKFSEPQGNLVVRLQDVSPDGTSTVITTGWLNVQHRLGHQKIAAILPDTLYTFRVELWPTHWRLRKGHVLRITISSGDIQHIEPTAPAGSTVTVLGGDDGSTIDLPIRREGPTPPVH